MHFGIHFVWSQSGGKYILYHAGIINYCLYICYNNYRHRVLANYTQKLVFSILPLTPANIYTYSA